MIGQKSFLTLLMRSEIFQCIDKKTTLKFQRFLQILNFVCVLIAVTLGFFFQRLLSENDRKLVVTKNILGITSCWVQNVNSSEWLRTFLVMHMWELKCGKRTMLIFTFIYASCLMEIVSTFYLKGILFQF